MELTAELGACQRCGTPSARPLCYGCFGVAGVVRQRALGFGPYVRVEPELDPEEAAARAAMFEATAAKRKMLSEAREKRESWVSAVRDMLDKEADRHVTNPDLHRSITAEIEKLHRAAQVLASAVPDSALGGLPDPKPLADYLCVRGVHGMPSVESVIARSKGEIIEHPVYVDHEKKTITISTWDPAEMRGAIKRKMEAVTASADPRVNAKRKGKGLPPWLR
jgi:hypothetical protein